MYRSQLAALGLSLASAFLVPFSTGVKLDRTDDLVRPVMTQKQPAPPSADEDLGYQPPSKVELNTKAAAVQAASQPLEQPPAPSTGYQGGGAGFNYGDPLENRVAALERWSKSADDRVAQIERDHAEWEKVHNRQQEILDRLAGTLSEMRSAAPATSKSSSGEVRSSTVVQDSQASSASAFRASPDGVVSVRQGASTLEVAAALSAMGYRSSYVPPASTAAYSYPVSSYGNYGSAGVSYSASYGSAGSAAVANYGSAGAAPVSGYSYQPAVMSYSAPVYQTSEAVVPYASAQTVQYYSAPARTGLFGRRAARSSGFGSYSAGNCRMVNGQMVCSY